ncbi:MAG: Crp/Fnr family transcriptional regulator [Bacteroidota bacterium]
MDEVIINFISKHIPLSEQEVEIIVSQNLIKHFKKNELLLAEGQQAKECYFVLNGCVRSYYLIDGEERNTNFYTENQAITPVSYQTQTPSAYYLSCLEDCVLAVGSAERNNELMEKIPKLSALIMEMNNQLLLQKEAELDNFKTFTPEQRYIKLVQQNPQLASRIPLYHLASYLGITQVSLSRIRKRISNRGV